LPKIILEVTFAGLNRNRLTKFSSGWGPLDGVEYANTIASGSEARTKPKECGAMKAVMANNPRPETPNLIKWLHHAHGAAFRLEHEGALDAKLKPHDQLSQLNVLVQLEHLMSYAIVRDKVSAGTLRLHGWWFDVASGSMCAYDRESRSFAVIDRQLADRLVARLTTP
jgi:carbonic anhydrase